MKLHDDIARTAAGWQERLSEVDCPSWQRTERQDAILLAVEEFLDDVPPEAGSVRPVRLLRAVFQRARGF